MSTNIVPFKNTNIVKYEFRLADEDINLMSREAVKALLPDILSRVLARSWIDMNYKKQLKNNVKATLAEGGVYLPEDYECVYVKSSGQRAKISIFEITGSLRLKVCSLSLTMIATR